MKQTNWRLVRESLLVGGGGAAVCFGILLAVTASLRTIRSAATPPPPSTPPPAASQPPTGDAVSAEEAAYRALRVATPLSTADRYKTRLWQQQSGQWIIKGEMSTPAQDGHIFSVWLVFNPDTGGYRVTLMEIDNEPSIVVGEY